MASDPSNSTILLEGSVHPPRAEDAIGLEFGTRDEEGDLLVVSEGPNAGTHYEIGTRVVKIGRSVDAELFFDDVTVSRHHAELMRNDRGRVVLKDLGSLNGTYLNRVRVDQAELEAGDEVQVGKFNLIFVPKRAGA
ncbi:MAG: FHA domain-containing protein [Actinomycetota bacterium]